MADLETDGILLVGHGTRDPDGTRQFFELASVLARQLTPTPVEACLLEFQHPTIPEAWEKLVERGARAIKVAPLLLFSAGHARADIPEAVFACASMTPGVKYSQSLPLSRARPLLDLLERRVANAASGADVRLDDPGVAMVLVGRGSYDPCARTDTLFLGEVLARRCGVKQHRVGFYAMADPRLPDVLDEVASQSTVRTIIIQPHLLFQGKLFDAIVRQVDEASQRNPGVLMIVADYLGPTEEVARALAHRIADSAEE